VHVVDIADDKLPSMEALYKQVKDVVDNMQRTRQYSIFIKRYTSYEE
jgi:hypothetical protein